MRDSRELEEKVFELWATSARVDKVGDLTAVLNASGLKRERSLQESREQRESWNGVRAALAGSDAGAHCEVSLVLGRLRSTLCGQIVQLKDHGTSICRGVDCTESTEG